MGAHLSCLHAGPAPAEPLRNVRSPRFLKLILPSESCTYEFSEPVKVAELMLEFPSHFVAELSSVFLCLPPQLRSAAAAGASAALALPMCSKRISPLPADHDAQLGHLYLLLPMHRLNTRLSGDELSLIAALAATPCSSAQCRMSSSLAKVSHMSSKVTPLSGHHCLQPAIRSKTVPTATIGGNTVSIAKSYSAPILEPSETMCSMEEINGTESGKNAMEQSIIPRSKSWTPMLETILESSHLTCQ